LTSARLTGGLIFSVADSNKWGKGNIPIGLDEHETCLTFFLAKGPTAGALGEYRRLVETQTWKGGEVMAGHDIYLLIEVCLLIEEG